MQTFTVSLLGAVIAVDLADSIGGAVGAELRDLWTPCLVEEAPTTRVYATLGAPSRVPPGYDYFTSADSARVLAGRLSDVLVSTAMSALLPSEQDTRPEWFGVYACAVVSEQGVPPKCLALVGGADALGGDRRSRVMTSLRGRFAHLTDAAIAVESATGTVRGATTPLRTYETELLSSRREVPLAAAGLRPAAAESVLEAVAFLEPTDAADDVGWEWLSVPEAVVRLAPSVPVLPGLRRPLQDLADVVARTSALVSVRYDQVSSLPSLLETAVGQASSSPLVLPVDPTVDEAAPPSPGAVRRVEMVDGVTDGSTMALCRMDRTSVAIAGIAPHLWDLTRVWTGRDELVDRLTDRLRVPTGTNAAALVDRAVEELVRLKVLTRLD